MDDILEIPLTKGMFAIIDAVDLPLIVGSKWRASQCGSKWYAVSTRNGRSVYLHRLIFVAKPGILVDHRDNDGLNNRRSNLRRANKSLNGANSGLSRRNKSGIKGVVWDASRGKWKADITVFGKTHSLGRYVEKEDAAKAYAEAARAAHGAFANPVGGLDDSRTICLFVPGRGV
ncbi:AP2 domain-containing protein [Mesorhizobium loti]|uniref:AP2 domain-containing protein n=1 Tax=Rhizobium loti TaxID=381 RepID=A0A8E2WAT7_RHILI|nr:AP2 domain-containing protein [Mesorhizobium loti]PWJ88410.1 AP2 domain-containing protein [Mesorhizobium loti]